MSMVKASPITYSTVPGWSDRFILAVYLENGTDSRIVCRTHPPDAHCLQSRAAAFDVARKLQALKEMDPQNVKGWMMQQSLSLAIQPAQILGVDSLEAAEQFSRRAFLGMVVEKPSPKSEEITKTRQLSRLNEGKRWFKSRRWGVHIQTKFQPEIRKDSWLTSRGLPEVSFYVHGKRLMLIEPLSMDTEDPVSTANEVAGTFALYQLALQESRLEYPVSMHTVFLGHSRKQYDQCSARFARLPAVHIVDAGKSTDERMFAREVEESAQTLAA